MRKRGFLKVLAAFSLIIFTACATIGGATPGQAGAGQLPAFTGDGGRGTRIAVLLPDAVGLPAEQNYLPTLVQSVLVGDLSRFSAMSVLDRVSLESVLAETESGIYQSPEDFGQLGEIANVDYVLTGSITRTGTGHALVVQVVGTGRANMGITRASFSGTPTVAEMDDFTGIRRASMDLLTQLGVSLTPSARQELSGAAAANRVSGEVALARGITAQRGGTEIMALSYYFHAVALDPSLLEAVNRSSILHANISSGNIGADVLNEIAWRSAWVDQLTETEQFFDSIRRAAPVPYTLFFVSDEIRQGTINWQTGTVNLSIYTHLYGSDIWALSVERALQSVYDGLRATGRAQVWGLANWPRQGVTGHNAFVGQRNNFSVVFELLNEHNTVIGRQTLQAGGSWDLRFGTHAAPRPTINVNASSRQTLTFNNVNAHAITDRMTIRVATVNGMDAAIAARDGVLQIRAITRDDFNANSQASNQFRFARGEIQGFAQRQQSGQHLAIPDSIWGDPVISIGERAFRDVSFSSVTIPDSVRHVGSEAFVNRVTGWTSDGRPFTYLTATTDRITIGSYVVMSEDAFCRSFQDAYQRNNEMAGVYFMGGARLAGGTHWVGPSQADQQAHRRRQTRRTTLGVLLVAAAPVGFLISNIIPR